jgi:hypothetical protein
MALWQRIWLVFAVIWVAVAALNAFTIYAFGEGVEREKAWLPVLAGVVVPAGVYSLAWLWVKIRGQRPNSG